MVDVSLPPLQAGVLAAGGAQVTLLLDTGGLGGLEVWLPPLQPGVLVTGGADVSLQGGPFVVLAGTGGALVHGVLDDVPLPVVSGGIPPEQLPLLVLL